MTTITKIKYPSSVEIRSKEIIDEIMTFAEGIKLFDHSFGEREVSPSEEELTGGDFLSLNPIPHTVFT